MISDFQPYMLAVICTDPSPFHFPTMPKCNMYCNYIAGQIIRSEQHLDMQGQSHLRPYQVLVFLIYAQSYVPPNNYGDPYSACKKRK